MLDPWLRHAEMRLSLELMLASQSIERWSPFGATGIHCVAAQVIDLGSGRIRPSLASENDQTWTCIQFAYVHLISLCPAFVLLASASFFLHKSFYGNIWRVDGAYAMTDLQY